MMTMFTESARASASSPHCAIASGGGGMAAMPIHGLLAISSSSPPSLPSLQHIATVQVH